MNTKLTLTVDESIIEKAKLYAKSKGRSLSDVIENYLKLLIAEDIDLEASTPIVDSLRGSFKAPDDLDYKKTLAEEIRKKHL